MPHERSPGSSSLVPASVHGRDADRLWALHEGEPAIDQRADDTDRASVEAVEDLPVRREAVA